MTAPTIPITNTKVEPSLKDLLDLLKKDIFLTLNCHALATIESFNAANQTVVATINYTRTFFKKGVDGATAPYQVKYPILIDCPVIVLGGGGGSITFPIAKGDQCLMLFNDRSIDNWVQGATSGPVSSSRAHSLADGLALVGLNTAVTYDGVNVVLTSPTKVKIQNSLTSLGDALSQLSGALTTFMTTVSTATTAGQIATAAGIAQSAVSAANVKIGELLL